MTTTTLRLPLLLPMLTTTMLMSRWMVVAVPFGISLLVSSIRDIGHTET